MLFGVLCVKTSLGTLHGLISPAAGFLHHNRLNQFYILSDSILLGILADNWLICLHFRTGRGNRSGIITSCHAKKTAKQYHNKENQNHNPPARSKGRNQGFCCRNDCLYDLNCGFCPLLCSLCGLLCPLCFLSPDSTSDCPPCTSDFFCLISFTAHASLPPCPGHIPPGQRAPGATLYCLLSSHGTAGFSPLPCLLLIYWLPALLFGPPFICLNSAFTDSFFLFPCKIPLSASRLFLSFAP